MLETKSLTVSPQEEQSIINVWTNFGWSLKSSQEINDTDSHLERRGDTLYNVTTNKNYVKLVFERDTKMENYDKVSALEDKFYTLINKEPELQHVKISGIITVIGLLIYVIPGVLYLVFKLSKRSRLKKEYQAAYAKWKAEDEPVAIAAFEEARSLI